MWDCVFDCIWFDEGHRPDAAVTVGIKAVGEISRMLNCLFSLYISSFIRLSEELLSGETPPLWNTCRETPQHESWGTVTNERSSSAQCVDNKRRCFTRLMVSPQPPPKHLEIVTLISKRSASHHSVTSNHTSCRGPDCNLVFVQMAVILSETESGFLGVFLSLLTAFLKVVKHWTESAEGWKNHSELHLDKSKRGKDFPLVSGLAVFIQPRLAYLCERNPVSHKTTLRPDPLPWQVSFPL